MSFESWMLRKGLSPSSVKKYVGAVEGPLTEWARENNIVTGSVTSFRSKNELDAAKARLKELTVFKQRNSRGHGMYAAALERLSEYLAEGQESDIEKDIEVVMNDRSISETERTDLIKARVGQGLFRQRLVAYWKRCSITGYADANLLVASHIKPWRASDNAERLSQFNGLLLIPNLDTAFDKGFITFDSSGLIVVSPQLTAPQSLGIAPNMRVTLSKDHQPFMEFHRTVMFRAV